MARMMAKCFFVVLLFLPSTLPCSAAQNLEAISIGGFTWNLSETGRQPADYDGQSEPRRMFLPWQMCRCQLSQSVATQAITVKKTPNWQAATGDGPSSVARFPFSKPECFLNEVFPGQRCYVVEADNNWMSRPKSPSRSTPAPADRLKNSGIPWMAANVIHIATNKLSPLATSLAHSLYQTASFTAQNVRFPIEGFPIVAVKPVNQRVSGITNKADSGTNPLRIADRLRPAFLPISSAANVEMSLTGSRFSFLKMPAATDLNVACKAPEQMDAYWKYYADCDRWKVVIARSPAEQNPKPALNRFTRSTSAWIKPFFASVAYLDNWLRQAIQQLEVQNRSILRDFQTTWKDIKFHLTQATFARSGDVFQKVHYSTIKRNSD